MDTDVRIKSVKTAFDIIEEMAREGDLTATEVAQRLDIPISTAHDYLQTLVQTRYVTREDDVYRPSYRFLKIGEIQRNRNKVYEIATGEMEKLAEATGQLVSLIVEEHGKGVQLAWVSGDEAVEFRTFSGVSLYLHTIGPGKAILAYLPEERVSEIIQTYGLQPMTPHTITDSSELRAELEQIRQEKIGIDRSECIEGLACVAAPILDSTDYPVAAISVCPPTSRLEDQAYEDELRTRISQAAEVIEVEYNYS